MKLSFLSQSLNSKFMGKKVHVYTGRALLWSIVKHDSRMARWALMLQEMDIRTNYIKGKKQIADALTRTPNMYE